MLFETGNSVEQLEVCACVCLSIVIMTQTKPIYAPVRQCTVCAVGKTMSSLSHEDFFIIVVIFHHNVMPQIFFYFGNKYILKYYT